MKSQQIVDLHTHSLYSSDGEFTPDSLVRQAKDAGLRAIALTDHNTMKGIQEAIEAGEKYGVEIIPGIEIDTQYSERGIHLLGYFLNSNSERLFILLRNMRDKYLEQAKKRIKKLNEMGLEITYQEAMMKAIDLPVGVILAQVVLENANNLKHPILKPYLSGGERCDQPFFNFHLDYFSNGKIASFPFEKPQTDKVIKIIIESGGIPVLAHPGSSFNPYNKEDLQIINELIEVGLVGIESYSTYHDKEIMQKFADFGKEHDLIITAGSDYHGKMKPKIQLGGVPNNDYQLLENLKRLKEG